MKAIELHQLNRQLGQYIIEFKDGKVNGYMITSFNGLDPDNLELVKTIDSPNRVTSWDGAYDLLFGKPEAPNFNRVLA
jgi:hypothetical protein